ncbi:MAG: hypothetical protein RLY43_984 [Bacteroidota bacterium]|jgi:hypothetical protein
MIVVYDNYKLSHSGVTKYRMFEGFSRSLHHNSLSNLLHQNVNQLESTEKENEEITTRHLNNQQSKKLKRYCAKLCYYSATRIFESKKSGKYKMKVSFLTLTAPEGTSNEQFLKSFDGFLDYLRRTANCVYVWKKELGETNKKLHVHLLINNFLPFYIVSWKWKRLLLSNNVIWPKNEQEKDTDSHYRIELPKSKKMVSSYIAKYMSKAYELPKSCGYVWGKSSVIDECKEITFSEGEINEDELRAIGDKYKIVGDDFVKHVCVDLLTVKDIAPTIFEAFEKQYMDFVQKITLPQKFYYT